MPVTTSAATAPKASRDHGGSAAAELGAVGGVRRPEHDQRAGRPGRRATPPSPPTCTAATTTARPGHGPATGWPIAAVAHDQPERQHARRPTAPGRATAACPRRQTGRSATPAPTARTARASSVQPVAEDAGGRQQRRVEDRRRARCPPRRGPAAGRSAAAPTRPPRPRPRSASRRSRADAQPAGPAARSTRTGTPIAERQPARSPATGPTGSAAATTGSVAVLGRRARRRPARRRRRRRRRPRRSGASRPRRRGR